jgi:hypothetical protein
VGKKHDKDGASGLNVNVEIAPGNQAKMDLYIKAYNSHAERKTPKVKYTDLVNEALDLFLSARVKAPRAKPAVGKK